MPDFGFRFVLREQIRVVENGLIQGKTSKIKFLFEWKYRRGIVMLNEFEREWAFKINKKVIFSPTKLWIGNCEFWQKNKATRSNLNK